MPIETSVEAGNVRVNAWTPAEVSTEVLATELQTTAFRPVAVSTTVERANMKVHIQALD